MKFRLGRKPKEPAGVALRTVMLTTPASELGIGPSERFPKVFGAMMDWPLGGNVATIVSICDGSASLYTTAEFGIIGGGEHETVRRAAMDFVETVGQHYKEASSTSDFSYGKAERVRFFLLCFDGVRSIDADLSAVKQSGDPHRDLWGKAQDVLTALRMTMPSETAKG